MSRPENELEVDHAALATEAERVELPTDTSAPGADAPAGGDAPGATIPPAASESWSAVTPGLIVVLDLVVCPNWELTDDEKTEFGAALVPVLHRLFPGGLGDERWAPYFRLAAVTLAIAASRFDREKFRFKPLREKKAEEPSEPGAAPRTAGNAGSFSTAPGAGP